jgi:hypothetical protein
MACNVGGNRFVCFVELGGDVRLRPVRADGSLGPAVFDVGLWRFGQTALTTYETDGRTHLLLLSKA